MLTVTRDRYDALVFDLDGTLLDGRAQLTPRTKAAVALARSRGYLVVIATGRSLAGTRDVHTALGLDTDVVCYNGNWIGRFDGSTPWHYAPIPDDLVGDLGVIERGGSFHFRHHRDRKYTPRTAHPHHLRITKWFSNVVEVDPGSPAIPSTDLLRVSVFFDADAHSDAAWGGLEDGSRARLHREVFPMSIFPEFEDVGLVLCEVQSKGRGKAEALRLLEERHGIPASRVVAVGDQSNDLPLLSRVGLAVSMANGIPAVREIAHVIIGDHRDEGVARWVEDQVA